MIGELIRRLLISGFAPLYAAAARQIVGVQLSCVIRNSANSSKNFHPFLSDIDFAIIGDLNVIQTRKLRRAHLIAQRFFLFLGELEIYGPQEWQNRNDDIHSLGHYFERVRTYRKSKWMERYLKKSRNPLGRLRAARGLRKCYTNMDCLHLNADDLKIRKSAFMMSALDELKENWALPKQDGEHDFKYYHPWLESVVGAGAAREIEIVLDQDRALLLAALFPIRNYPSQIDSQVQALRQVPEVFSHLKTYARLELAVMTASTRGMSPLPDWYLANMPDLKFWVET